MSKKVTAYNLDMRVIKEIEKKAASEERSSSSWLNLYLIKQFKLNKTEPKKAKEVVNDVVVGEVPCSNGVYQVLQKDINLWCSAYPDINVSGELNKLVAWLESNPKKTVSGCKRFINSWLNRAQNSVKTPRYNSINKTSGNLQACEDFLHD